MRTFISVFVLSFFGLAMTAGATKLDYLPTDDPSRIVLTPAANGSTGQLVTWRTQSATSAGSVEFQPVAGGSTQVVQATVGAPIDFSGWTYSSIHHRAELSGLTPGTKYRYRVGAEGHWSDWFNFETAASDQSSWEMLYFGDAQNNLGTRWAPVVAKAFERTPNAKLALHAGDLINDPDDDDQWGDWFAGMGDHATSVNQLAVVGNHERGGDANLKQFGGHFSNPGNGPATLKNSVYFTDYQDVRFIALNGTFTFIGQQLEFLESALRDNPNKWSVVSIHEPIFAGGKARDNNLVRDPILPILRKYNVDLVLQGHDHVYARGVMDDDIDPSTGFGSGPVFAVTIAGTKFYELDPGEKNNWTDNGATRVAAFNETSTYQPISFDGNVLTYRSYIAYKGAESSATGEVGDLLDAFTITKRSDGTKVVSEGETPPVLPDVETPKPRPSLTIKKVTRNKKNGTAKVTLAADASGTLRVSGKGIRSVTKKTRAKQRVTVQIKTKAKSNRQLRRKGKYSTKVKFNLRANGAQAPEVSRRITLIKK